jgi:hypothetical protein
VLSADTRLAEDTAAGNISAQTDAELQDVLSGRTAEKDKTLLHNIKDRRPFAYEKI